MRTSFPLQERKRGLARYALALLATILTLVIRRVLGPLLGAYIPYLLVFPAIVFSALYCGLPLKPDISARFPG
jgi:hypothetical protein